MSGGDFFDHVPRQVGDMARHHRDLVRRAARRQQPVAAVARDLHHAPPLVDVDHQQRLPRRPVADHVHLVAAVDADQRPAVIGIDRDGEVASLVARAADAHDLRRVGKFGLAQLPVDHRRARRMGQRDQRADRGEVAQQFVVGGRAVESVGIFLGDEAGGQRARAEARVLQQRREEVDIVRNPAELERVERLDLPRRSRPRGSAPR